MTIENAAWVGRLANKAHELDAALYATKQATRRMMNSQFEEFDVQFDDDSLRDIPREIAVAAAELVAERLSEELQKVKDEIAAI